MTETSKRLFCLALLFTVFLAAPRDASAQSGAPRTPVPSGLVLGRVVDGVTNQPVSGASVLLSAVAASSSSNAGSITGTRQLVTGGDGYFVFRDLPRGEYRVRASAPGYLTANGPGMNRPAGPSRTVSLADGQKVGDVVVRMWRTASLSGDVFDEQGEPLEGITVTALKVETIGGRRRFTMPTTATTDDRGSYRISSLSPGEYVVCALFSRHVLPISASGGGSGYRMGDLMLVSASGVRNVDPAPDERGRLSVFGDVCYPAAPNVPSAMPIAVESGVERGATGLTLRLVTTARIGGTVVGAAGRSESVTVHLVAAETPDAAMESEIDAAYTSTDASGAFGFVGVTPGSYVLKVAETSQDGRFYTTDNVDGVQIVRPQRSQSATAVWASTPVDVRDADVNGIVLSLRDGARAGGHVAFDGGRERPAGDRLASLSIGFTPFGGNSQRYTTPGVFGSDGRFQTGNSLLPGEYQVRVSGIPSGWALKSVVAGGRDVADELLVVTGSDIAGIVVNLTDHPSEISGSVRDESGMADENASVILFPAERSQSSQVVPWSRRWQTKRASSTGAYAFSALPAGDYYVVAVDDRIEFNLQDPKTVETLAHAATRITVHDAEKRNQDLTTARIR